MTKHEELAAIAGAIEAIQNAITAVVDAVRTAMDDANGEELALLLDKLGELSELGSALTRDADDLSMDVDDAMAVFDGCATLVFWSEE